MDVKFFINVNSYGGYMLKLNLLIVLSVILFSISSFAQDDSTKTPKDWEWHWNEWDDWNDSRIFAKFVSVSA